GFRPFDRLISTISLIGPRARPKHSTTAGKARSGGTGRAGATYLMRGVPGIVQTKGVDCGRDRDGREDRLDRQRRGVWDPGLRAEEVAQAGAQRLPERAATAGWRAAEVSARRGGTAGKSLHAGGGPGAIRRCPLIAATGREIFETPRSRGCDP